MTEEKIEKTEITNYNPENADTIFDEFKDAVFEDSDLIQDGQWITFCKGLENGLSITDSLIKAKIKTPKSFYDKYKKDDVFRLEIDRIKINFKEIQLENIAKAGKDKKNWVASAWLLERKFQKEFALQKKEVPIGVNINKIDIYEGLSEKQLDEKIRTLIGTGKEEGKEKPDILDGEYSELPENGEAPQGSGKLLNESGDRKEERNNSPAENALEDNGNNDKLGDTAVDDKS